MKFYKNKKVLASIIMLILIISLFIGCYWYYHPTHFKYNDRFVVGNSVSAIAERYGEFDKIFYKDLHDSKSGISSGGYMVEPRKQGFLGTDWAKYYMIRFVNGKAVSVRIEEGNWGG